MRHWNGACLTNIPTYLCHLAHNFGVIVILCLLVLANDCVKFIVYFACSLEIAKSLGATHTVLSKRDSDPKEVASAIAQVVKHQGGLDYSIDTTGVPSVLRLGVEGLRATGVAALVGGSPPGSELKVDMLT